MSAAEAPSLAATFARSERIVGRRVADQFLLVPIVSRGADVDCLYNLNRVGTFIWERLDGRTAGSEIVEALRDRFEVGREKAEEDYRGFLLSLVDIGAVQEVPPSGPELA